MNFENLTTDELLDLLPDHLMLARNSQADSNDRFRIYNRTFSKFVKTGHETAREALIDMLNRIEE